MLRKATVKKGDFVGETKPKKCLFCGRFFIPDPRVGDRQKACSREQCQKERKKLAQFRWCRRNPKYFADRYEYVRNWREKRISRNVSETPSDTSNKRVRKNNAIKKGSSNGNGWYKK